MKPKKTLKKRLAAFLTSALILISGAAAAVPRLLQQSVSDRVSAAADDSFSESRLLDDLLRSDDESEAEIRDAFLSASDFPASYRELGYEVFYSKGLASDFILVYNSRDFDLRAAVTSPEGLLWASNYAKYLSVLSQMTGVQRKNLICVFNTDLDSGYPGANHDTWFHISHDAAFAAAGGILTNRFTHALLHETAHSFHTNFYKMLFNSEEEVFVNLRMLCALHWAGMDSGQMLLTNASSKWTWTDGSVAEQYMYQDRGMISLTDPAYQAYFPESSGVWDLWEMKSTFVPVSVRQNFALSAYTDSSAGRLFARSAAIVSAAADRPVSCSFSDDPSDSNNWLNTDAIDANWETVSEEEWKKLTVLCVSDADHVSLPDAAKDIVKMYCSYLSKCTEELRYFFFVKADGKNVRKEYTVRVTPAVCEMISANCKAENGAFRVSGNLIQAFNMFDFMENGMDETLILNQYLRPAPAFRAFCLKTMTADYENRHAFMPTVQTPEIIGQPENADAAVGDTVSFTVEAAGIGMTYQWQYRAGTKWRDSVMTGADTATVCKEVQEGRDMQEYRCIVSWPDGHQEISETALLRIRPTITEQPQNSEAAPGETAIFRAEASGTDLTYQWQFSSGAEWEDSDVTGADTEEIAVPVSAEQDGTLFRCVISGRSGAQTVSDEAELIVRKGITSQPEDIETAEGEDVQFSVGVSGNGVTCQWQFSKGNGWKDSGMTGADSDTVTVPAAFSRDGQQYRCVVSWPDGTQEFSDAAVLRVRPTIVEQPSDVTAPAGFIAVFTAAADGKDLTYQWEVFSGTEWAAADSSGADTDTLRVTAAEAINGQQYRCVITGSSGAQSVSEPAVLTIE